MSTVTKQPSKKQSCTPIIVKNINEMWQVGVIGPLEESSTAKRYVVSLIDVFSRRGKAYAVRNKNAYNVITCLKRTIKEWGKPQKLLTDIGLGLTNMALNEWCQANEILLKHGSPYTPSTQGSIERFNQSFIKKLSKITNFGLYDWESQLENAIRGYNASFSRPIGCVPDELWNKISTVDIDKKYNVDDLKRIDISELSARVCNKLEEYQESFRKIGRGDIFKEGDEVWYHDPSKKPKKLQSKWNTRGSVIEVKYDSCRISTEGGRIVIGIKNTYRKDKEPKQGRVLRMKPWAYLIRPIRCQV